MPDNILLKDLTRYGDRYIRISDILPYVSSRTIEQYEKMRMYPVCWLGLNFIKLGLADVPFNVVCEEDENIRLITEKVLKRIWNKLIREAAEELDYGIKPFEIRYEKAMIKYYDENDNLETYEGLLLKSPKGIHPSTIEILTDPIDGSFTGFRQDCDDKRKCLASEKKALLFTHCLESGNYWGISAQEPIYSYWYDANINRQFAMRWLERIGTGMFKGQYPDGTSNVDGTDKDNQEIMLELLDGIIEGTHVALPSGRDDKGNLKWDINLIEGADKTDPFIQRARYIDEMILRGLIIPEKALVQDDVGARASIESFQNMFIQRKQEILDQIVDTIDRYLIKPFVELNWGSEVDLHVKAGQLSDSSKQIAGDIVKKLAETGMVTVEQQWLVDKTGIKLVEPEEKNIANELQAQINTKQQLLNNPNQQQPETPNQAQQKQQEEGEQAEEKFAETGRWRAFTKLENQFKMSELDDFLDSAAEEFKADLSSELNFQGDKIKKYIEKNYAQISTGKYIPIIDDISLKPGPIKSLVSEYERKVYDYILENFQSSIEGEEEFAALDSSNAFIGFRSSLTGGKITTDVETMLKFQLGNLAAQTAAKQEMLDEISRIIREYIESSSVRIAETEIGFLIDKANSDYYELNRKLVESGELPEEKKIKRFVYSGVLDSSICDLCEEMDGTIVDEDSPILTEYATPQHYNCRCVWLPITQEDIEAEKDRYSLSTDEKGKVYTSSTFNSEMGDLISKRTFSEGECKCHSTKK